MAGRILTGDCRQTVPTLPAGCAHVCVTSPPYWNLRSYLPGDHASKALEIGSEPTPELYIETMVNVMRAVRHALRDDGLLFVNMGDSYAQDEKWGGTTGGKHAKGLHGTTGIGRNRTNTGLKSGDICNMPHRVATALRADGWFWRDTIVWRKPAPMPSSQNGVRWERCRVKVATAPRGGRSDTPARNGKPMANHESHDFARNKYAPCPGCGKCRDTGGYILRRGRFRTTTAHEFIFMFSKSKAYFADAERCKEVAVGGTPGNKNHKGATEYANGNGKHRLAVGLANMVASETRLPRSVWTISPEPFKGAHFATYPSELVRRCLLMGISAKGCCPACGNQYAPVVEMERVPTRPALNNKIWKHIDGDQVGQRSHASPNLDPQRHIQRSKVHAYWPTCTCNAGDPVPCTVLDPFGGSGTTAQAAHWMGCDWIICELNEEYAALANERILIPPKWARPKSSPRIKSMPNQLDLFNDQRPQRPDEAARAGRSA